MFNPWKQKPVLGIGIGVGLVGAVALAARYGFRQAPRERIPDDISPAIFATRVADTSFGEMVYHISGTGDPLVFLHGIYLGANSYEWSKVYPHFTLGRQVIVPDLIGFGESERPDIAMDASDYAETLVEFLRNTCGDRRPAIVASGLTAGLALLLASRHPEHVERLVLLLPTGLKGAGKWAATGMATLVRLPGFNRFVYRNYLSRAPFIRGWLTKFALGNPARMNEEMVRALTTCAQQPGAEHAIFGFLRGQLAFDVESRLDSVPHPVSILWPDRASGFPRSTGEAMSRKLKRAKLVTIPDCGILAALEAPAVMTSILTTELEGDLRLEGAA
ncbi:MAG TPA: alpha/beta hydrolase [Terrimicrobiaceae bacterium]|nr:alpha/beta hydrolase [Terrimicrobiaceae bacterium]